MAATDVVTARMWTAPSVSWATTAVAIAKVAESACRVAVNVS